MIVIFQAGGIPYRRSRKTGDSLQRNRQANAPVTHMIRAQPARQANSYFAFELLSKSLRAATFALPQTISSRRIRGSYVGYGLLPIGPSATIIRSKIALPELSGPSVKRLVAPPVPLAMLLCGLAGLIPLVAINNFKVPFAPVPLVHSIQTS